ncbi:MAG: hypothetical protein E7F96_03795 [Veillonella sp.]|uniref:hypothetical protein n=1 Tax=Veillonella sp. TaxID=1926307 RepID=UPI00290E6FC6|nr:hypothetical protein [Veillonella sp.]MDU3601412.1 hypothetical protein [Veillonella sp.]
MKRIDVVELYVIKRIELLERANGEYQINKKEIAELKEVLDVINRVNFDKQVRDDKELGLLSDTLDKIDKCLSKMEED